MKIGELAQQTGVSVATLRFYENQGLIQSSRGIGRYRYFTESAVADVHRIRNYRALDLSLPEIRKLLGWTDTPQEKCGEVCALMQTQLQRVREQKQILEQLESELARWVEICPGAPGSTCQILAQSSRPKSP